MKFGKLIKSPKHFCILRFDLLQRVKMVNAKCLKIKTSKVPNSQFFRQLLIQSRHYQQGGGQEISKSSQ